MSIDILIPLLAAAVQSGTPILYATLGEIFTERSGILNLGVEGIMIIGALTGFLVAKATGNPYVAFIAAGLAGSCAGSIHGLVCLVFQGNQVVSGLALTILGVGVANYLGTPYVGLTAPGFDPLPIPVLAEIPVIGAIFFSQDLLVYLTYLIPVLMWIFLYNTRFGLSLRAAGEYPAAATAAGLNVAGYRWLGVLVGGFFMGWAGPICPLPIPICGPITSQADVAGSLLPWSYLPFGGRVGLCSELICLAASWRCSFGCRPRGPRFHHLCC